MMGLLSGGIIPFSKLSISNLSAYGTYIPLVIANTFSASKLTSSLLTQLSENSLGIVNAANLDTYLAQQPTNDQILSYDAVNAKLKWIS